MCKVLDSPNPLFSQVLRFVFLAVRIVWVRHIFAVAGAQAALRGSIVAQRNILLSKNAVLGALLLFWFSTFTASGYAAGAQQRAGRRCRRLRQISANSDR